MDDGEIEDEIAKELELLSDDYASDDISLDGENVPQILAINLKEPEKPEVFFVIIPIYLTIILQWFVFLD